MIRTSAVFCLVTLLILILYIPSTYPPERFTTQIRLEHAAAAAFWGEGVANQMLERAVQMQVQAADIAPIPKSSNTPSTDGVNNAVAQEMESVNQRLFNNSYFRSVDALLLLGSYRLASLLHWFPWLLTFSLATASDGTFTRIRKSKELVQHDPEIFALYACLVIITLSSTVAGLAVPFSLHPLLLPCVPLLVSVLLGRAAGNFHKKT